MDSPPEIVDLAKVIEPHLNGGKLVTYSSRYLTKPGDNYGSVMLALNATIASPDGKNYKQPLVAKLPPLTNEMFWKFFKPEVTALKENAIYLKVSPALHELQLDSGVPESKTINVFAKHFGCRISLDEKATALDRNAVLVLENLQVSGYKPGKRQIMFDEVHTKFILKNLAKYHALPIAFRKRNPEKFINDFLPHFGRFDISQEMDPEAEKEFKAQIFEEVQIALEDDPKAFERFKELEAIFTEFMANTEECEDGLFTTLAHYDLWTNNVMIKYDESGAPSELKIVDFQITQYESLMHDVIFFLLTSVETNVVENKFYELLRFYYDEFIECLETTLCKTDEYSFEEFLKEVQRIGPVQIHHSLFMSRVLLAEDSNMPKDFKEVNMEMLKVAPSKVLLTKLRDIVRIAQKYGFFW